MLKNPKDKSPLAVIGIGVACGAGFGKEAFSDALYTAPNLFSYLSREGRETQEGHSPFIGVEIPEIQKTHLPARLERTLSLSARVAVSVVQEAWLEAGLDKYDPERIGVVVGGTALMAREQELAIAAYQDRTSFIPPRMGHIFLDTEIAAVLASTFPIRGVCETTNAASASGAAAILQAMRAIQEDRVDVCIAVGALQDISLMNLYTMRSMGAMGGASNTDCPEKACRPMSQNSDGFIYGESCAALVIERCNGTHSPYGFIAGGAAVPDGSRGPEPDSMGQQKAAQIALKQAGLTNKDIDYVNGHATGTPLGDKTEASTYQALGLDHAWINTTKSLIGHSLSAAGAIETAAVFLQMKYGKLHPCRNLDQPVDPGLKFTSTVPEQHAIKNALKFSFGFGGINTALVLTAAQ
ncbi:beta-ketoacyl synthase N-terminal-like domain-containing protein [Kordiimonas pumila]|uniref:Beta-ketoacyl synthase N-terminal-like domain-containing protein n=1 Tax=Kordiimonas pumila TaxID=2161677 RepID=A0ABV7D3E5_9PROT|nr:beta-ketoacyl synthase N-terminal-like domain-containing protein [Kordiimonas pumila]